MVLSFAQSGQLVGKITDFQAIAKTKTIQVKALRNMLARFWH
jgi:hypothetical protein